MNKKLLNEAENHALNNGHVSSTVYLTSRNHYGDGQFYFKCDKCGEELCGRTTETIECTCGHNTDCIYDYE